VYDLHNEQEQSETAYLRDGECAPDDRTSDPDYFQNLMGTSLLKVTFALKFSRRSVQYVQRYEPNCEKYYHFSQR